jgi:hypothetical protein
MRSRNDRVGSRLCSRVTSSGAPGSTENREAVLGIVAQALGNRLSGGFVERDLTAPAPSNSISGPRPAPSFQLGTQPLLPLA